jgi:hypothetical protein
MANTESIDWRHFSRSVIVDLFTKCPYSYADIFPSPIALTAILCHFFQLDERHSFSVCPGLNGGNSCFHLLADLP